MIVYRRGSKPDAFQAEIQGVQRVKEMKILGVIVSENLSFKTHLDAKLKETAQGLYALKVLKFHGLKNENLWDITKATLVSKLLYASPVWWGFADSETKHRLQSYTEKTGQILIPSQKPSTLWFALRKSRRKFVFIYLGQRWSCSPSITAPHKRYTLCIAS